MLIVFTGNGKGKTTAALGQAMRMVGRGKRVLMIQFIKGPWGTGEEKTEVRMKSFDSAKDESQTNKGMFEIRKRGRGFVGILGDTLPREEHIRAAQQALAEAQRELMAGSWDLLICDEINNALDLQLVSLEDVLGLVAAARPEQFLLFTGRGAHEKVLECADLATEMRELKHPFNNGKLAKIALEF